MGGGGARGARPGTQHSTPTLTLPRSTGGGSRRSTGGGEILLNIIRRNDSKRMVEVVRKLAEVFETGGIKTELDENAVIDMVVRRHGCAREMVYLQERHAAQAFQEALFRLIPPAQRIEKLNRVLGACTKAGPEDAVRIQNDIRSHLMKAGKPAFVAETFVNFKQAYRLILEMGGIPCYPTLADGTRPICAFEEPVEKLIEQIKGRGIHMVEFIPLRNTPQVLAKYAKAMRQAGLVVLGGTEHNTLDLSPLDPACIDGQSVPDEIKDLFWEGACVVGAHQVLSLRGECGFVDGEGKPNPAYRGSDERIEAFARIGKSLIEAYAGGCQ